MGDHVITILDVSSATLRRVIETHTEIHYVKVSDNAIFVIGTDVFTQWDLEAGRRVRDQMSIVLGRVDQRSRFTISHDCSGVVSVGVDSSANTRVCTHSARPPETITFGGPDRLDVIDIRFSPDGREVWYLQRIQDLSGPVENPSFRKWGVPLKGRNGGAEAVVTRYITGEEWKTVGADPLPDGGWSWVDLFSCGYHITKGAKWAEDSKSNKLLWLAPNWRLADGSDVRWDGNFLTLMASHHPEPIIVEFRSS